jgi:hypothetical protein
MNGGGLASKDSVLDERDVILKARSYLNTVMKPIIFEKKNEGDNSAITQALYPYELIVDVDATEQKFATIPDTFMALPDNRGLWRVFMKGNYTRDFVLQHNPGISGNLPHTKLKNIQYCYVEGLKVKFAKGCTVRKGDHIIVQIWNMAPDALGDNDPLPMVPEQLAELNSMLKKDFAPFAQIPQDMLNNQNTNIR